MGVRTTPRGLWRRTTRFRPSSTTTTVFNRTAVEQIRKIIPERPKQIVSRNNILKNVSRKPIFRSTTPRTTDQSLESTNQLLKGIDETTKISELATVLHEMQKASIRPRNAPKINKQVFIPIPTKPTVYTTPFLIHHEEPRPFEKQIRIYVPDVTPKAYDYYDIDAIKIVSELPINSKVVLHGSGNVQCLDQGNFPHPTSCRKFISCAKVDSGDILGWEYRCPKDLSYDPVGGMCNWATGFGCND